MAGFTGVVFMAEIRTIAVIGLGLIGGSVLKGLKNKGYKLLGIARRQETIEQALNEKIIDEGSVDINIACEADLIFVCTPINNTIETIKYLQEKVKAETIITDAASIKGKIINFANSGGFMRFIGGHPMAGTENKGLEESSESLFVGAKWVLTPSKRSSEDDLSSLSAVIEKLGAKIIIADPVQHDKAVALISHMPLFLSQALYNFIKNYPDEEISRLALCLAAGGFRDMTRLAATNPELAQDMLIENKSNVLESIQELQKHLDMFKKELSENGESFVKLSEELAVERKKMYSPDGKNVL